MRCSLQSSGQPQKGGRHPARGQRAETGHLVFGTLHTTGASKTIDRVVNAFPINQQEQIRIQLSTGLQAVISQLPIPRIDKPGCVEVFEVVIKTP